MYVITRKNSLTQKAKQGGVIPLAIRITKNLRSTFRYVGHYIEIKEWDEINLSVKKTHPNYQHLNSLLTTQLSEVNKALIVLQSEHKDASANQIKKDIYHSDSNSTFFELAEEHLNDLGSLEKFNRLACDKA
ncbi:Arm DNA-binding domain-containing protein [Gelidibacter pelagius]|uniref:Arm DNA-binding domain-containing protein n=1 Tax=Gelidibacter pelagius TaxID=2819985 RepID=UPI001F1CEC0F|nr:Arm DNA-binding domain-containing protein [Gelidibacter pelagius]